MGDNLRQHYAMMKRLRRQLKELEQRRQAILDAIKAHEALVRLGGGEADESRSARESPVATAAVQALSVHGEPMRIPELIAAMQAAGWEKDKAAEKVRATLVSALRRRRDLFTTPSRGVYGLREFEEDRAEDTNQGH